MRRHLLPALGLLLLSACPEPPKSASPSPNAAQVPGGDAPQGPTGSPALNGEGAAPAGSAAMTGSGKNDLQLGPGELPAGAVPQGLPQDANKLQHTQEQLAAESGAYALSGTLSCAAGGGPFWLHAFPPPDEKPDPGAQRATGPVTGMPLAGPGPFTLRLPKGRYMVVGFDDANQDGLPDPQKGVFFANDGQPVAEGGPLNLDCASAKKPEQAGAAPPSTAPGL